LSFNKLRAQSSAVIHQLIEKVENQFQNQAASKTTGKPALGFSVSLMQTFAGYA